MVKIKTEFVVVLIILISLCIFGCTTSSQKKTIEYVQTPVYVNIPVIEKPSIKPISRPVLEINKLTDESTPSEIVEAYYNSLQQIIKYTKLLEKALTPFYEEYENGRNKK